MLSNEHMPAGTDHRLPFAMAQCHCWYGKSPLYPSSRRSKLAACQHCQQLCCVDPPRQDQPLIYASVTAGVLIKSLHTKKGEQQAKKQLLVLGIALLCAFLWSMFEW